MRKLIPRRHKFTHKKAKTMGRENSRKLESIRGKGKGGGRER